MTSQTVRIPDDLARNLVDPAAYADDRLHQTYSWLRANNPLSLAEEGGFDSVRGPPPPRRHSRDQPAERAVPQRRPVDDPYRPGWRGARPRNHRRQPAPGALAGADGRARSPQIPRPDSELV